MGALPTELTMIKNSGTPFEPMDAGRITTWMDPSDKYVDSWFDHLVNKDVPCCVAKKSNGQLAVFRAASDVVRA